ncbi:MAG TPA: Gfo/Idh/MocA family oxidoreductase [Terriglobia bacterium]|nr:Gfo/Idh/MocA family oxidoreductase [Terriglobia bacterium]
MQNTAQNSQKQPDPGTVDRRQFLRTAAGASMALTGAVPAAARRRIASNAVIRVGLIGRDGHREILLGSIPKLANVQWTAYAKGEPGEDSAWVQKQFPASERTRVYDDYHQMLEKEELDVVGVCLPFFRNAEASIQAASRGIHVVSEKPAALTLPDLARLEQAVRETGITYNIMLAMRALPIFLAARHAVQQGTIGEPILLSSQKSYQWGADRPWYYKERKTYGGTIPWVGIHALDYMRWVSGQEYAMVSAWQGNQAHPQDPGCEDHAGLLFRLANGGTATCHLDFLRPAGATTHGDDRLRVAGHEGVLEATDIGNRVSVIDAKGTRELPLPAPVDFFGSFLASLRGEGEPLVSTVDAFAITRICLRARDAADTGSWITL